MPAKRKTAKKSIDTLAKELKEMEHFRVAIFGSARIKSADPIYKDVKKLARKIGKSGWDIVTGGGPGLMQAANAGHTLGDNHNKARSIGLTIRLPWETKDNKHLEIKKYFKDFSPRLLTFMKLSDAVVVTPGGVGTCLEFFYTWQLIQVKHKHAIPVVLVGNMWKQLIEWVKKYPIKQGLISPGDLDSITVARNYDHAFEILQRYYIEKVNAKRKK